MSGGGVGQDEVVVVERPGLFHLLVDRRAGGQLLTREAGGAQSEDRGLGDRERADGRIVIEIIASTIVNPASPCSRRRSECMKRIINLSASSPLCKCRPDGGRA